MLFIMGYRSVETMEIFRVLDKERVRTGKGLVQDGESLRAPLGWRGFPLTHVTIGQDRQTWDETKKRDNNDGIVIVGMKSPTEPEQGVIYLPEVTGSPEMFWDSSLTRRVFALAALTPVMEDWYCAATNYLAAAYNDCCPGVNPEEFLEHRTWIFAQNWKKAIHDRKMNSTLRAQITEGSNLKDPKEWFEAVVRCLKNCREVIFNSPEISFPSGSVRDLRDHPGNMPGLPEAAAVLNIAVLIRRNNNCSLHGAGEGSQAGGAIVREVAEWAQRNGAEVLSCCPQQGKCGFRQEK